MADLDDDTKLCTNCDKQIKNSNFLTHEAFCMKRIVKCKKCNQPIDKTCQQAHFDEFHSMVRCECGDEVEKASLEKHKTEKCKKRKAPCEYCDLSLEIVKLDEHESHCGARTEECEKCNRRVQYKDRKRHDETNCEYPEVRARAFPQPPSQQQQPLHQPESPPPYIRQFVSTLNSLGLEDLSGEHDFNHRIGTNLEENRRSNFREPLGATAIDPYDNNQSDDELEYLPCEFCNEIYPSNVLFNHQVNCNLNTTSTSLGFHADMPNLNDRNPSPDEAIDDSSPPQYSDARQDHRGRKPNRNDSNNNEIIMIPCERCQHSFDIDTYKTHFLECQNGSIFRNNRLSSKLFSTKNSGVKHSDSSLFFMENEKNSALRFDNLTNSNRLNSLTKSSSFQNSNSSSFISTNPTSRSGKQTSLRSRPDRSNENKHRLQRSPSKNNRQPNKKP